jgi:Asp-tRNA(Asn)/Glu-tRNA(Gln) amidotransferase A subunit family amidase
MGTRVIRIAAGADGSDAAPRLAVKDCIDVAGLPTTAPANLAGLPALALPVTAAAGVIASIQVIGPTEERVLAFGRVIETALRA